MSDKLQELKLREVGMPEPPPETAARVWLAIGSQIASGEPLLELKAGPLITELPARVVTLKLVLGGALVVLGVVGAGVAGSRWRAKATAPKASAVAPVETERDVAIEAPPSSPIAPLAPIAPIVANDPTSAVEAPPRPVVVAPKAKPKPEPEPKPRTLADEVALIHAISKGLKQGAWKSVLELVTEHERDFANGEFIEERQAAKVRAQCGSGTLDAGRNAAENFLARWPSSIHRATIREDCGL